MAKIKIVTLVIIMLLTSCQIQKAVYVSGVATFVGCATLLYLIKFKTK